MTDKVQRFLTGLTVLSALVSMAIVIRRELNTGTRKPPEHVALTNMGQLAASAGWSMGDTASDRRMVVFSDFECPFCGRLMKLADSLRANGTPLTLTIRHVVSPAHRHSRTLASAFECGVGQAEPWALALTLFERAPQATDSVVAKIASSHGITDSLSFARCMNSTATQAVISRDSVVADKLEIRGTPTVFIGKYRLNGLPSADTLLKYLASDSR